MRRLQLETIAFMVLGALILGSAPSYGASKKAYQNVFTEHLEVGPATYLNLNFHGTSAADIDKDLTEIYHNNGMLPLWIRDGNPDKHAANILAVLEDSENHGLDPDSYFVDQIRQYWNSKDVAGLVRLDILLTLGMIRYVADQREGLIEPREIDAKLFASARDVEVDWDLLLQTAFEAPDMKALLDHQTPVFSDTTRLLTACSNSSGVLSATAASGWTGQQKWRPGCWVEKKKIGSTGIDVVK